METLVGVFPDIPRPILLLIFEISGSNLETASAWLLENDWRDIENSLRATNELNNQEETNEDTDRQNETEVPAQEEAPESPEESDTNPNDDLSSLSDEDDNDDDGAVDTPEGVDAAFDAETALEAFRFAHRRAGAKKRRRNRVLPTSPRSLNDSLRAKEKRYWLKIDDKIMLKTHLELLNTALANTAHRSVALSSDNSEYVTPGEALKRLSRISSRKGKTEKEDDGSTTDNRMQEQGYWAYFFDIEEVDQVWRYMLSSHIGGLKFGDMFEIRVCSSGAAASKPFDYLNGRFRNRGATVCLLVPCPAAHDRLFALGSNIISTLLLNDPIYYRERKDLTSPIEEDFFEVGSKDEHMLASNFKMAKHITNRNESLDTEKMVVSGNKKVSYCLYRLENVTWIPVGLQH